MKRIMKKCLAVGAAAGTLFALSGCWSGSGQEGAFRFATQGKEAMVYHYQWDGDEENRTIVIPETYMGKYTVTTVGGYIGRGYPCPFAIFLPAEIETAYSIDGGYDPDELVEIGWFESYTIVNYEFRLILGANVKDVSYVDQCVWVCKDGERATLYYLRVYVECAAENKHYYSENGRLYQADGALVEGFLYAE